MTPSPIARCIAIGAATLALAAVTVGSADARSRSYTGRDGRTWTRTVTPYNNGGGDLGRTVATTRPDGRTATSSFARTVSSGTITDTRTSVGFNGATTHATLTRTPGEGGSWTYTGRDGGLHSGAFSPGP